MSRMDWQAFDDGSLSAEERAVAVDRLKQDDVAHRELEGLKSFQKTIRQRGMSEAIPHDRLNGMLRRVCGRQEVSPAQRWVIPTAAVAACLIAAAVIFRPRPEPIVFDTSPQLTAVTTHNPTDAANWVRKQSGVQVPVISLAGVPSRIEGARCGSCWVSYDYRIGDDKYTIFAKQSWHAFEKVRRREFREGHEFYLSDDAIGWYCAGGMSYLVVGGDEPSRWKVALAARKETAKVKS